MERQTKCMALEKKHVHDVYDSTAHHFRDVRYKAWPRVRQFLMDLEPASIVADVGCGSGKYLHINKNVFKLGCDRSEALVNIAGGRHHSALVCDNLRLPYRDNAFDAVISIGVIHHFTTRDRRAQALRELARVLRPGGKLMVYVWAMEQRHRQFEAQDVLVPWHFQPTPKQKRKKDMCRLQNARSETFSDDEGVNDGTGSNIKATHVRRKATGHHVTPVNRCRGLRHHELGDGAKPKVGPDCRQKRKTFHKQKQFVDSTHSRDGGSSSCASTATPSPSFDLGTSADFTVDTNKVNSSHHQQVKRSNSLKNWVTNLFSTAFQKEDPKELPKLRGRHGCPMKLKDTEYKELICRIMKEDFEMFQKQRPLLEHSLSTPDADLFAVREFPQSSQPELRKIQSLDSGPHTKETPPCSKYTKKYEEENGDERNANNGPLQGCASQVSKLSIHHKEDANNGAINLLNTTEVVTDNTDNGNAKCCALDGLATTGSLLKETPEGLVRCQINGQTSTLSCLTDSGKHCPTYKNISVDSQDGKSVVHDISSRKSEEEIAGLRSKICQKSHSNENELEKRSETNGFIGESSNGHFTNGIGCQNSNLNRMNSLDNSHGNKFSSIKDTNGVYLPRELAQQEAGQSDSSPESPSCDSELNGHEGSQEGSSLSSPEDDTTQGLEEEAALPRLLEEVGEVQYPSLSDSDADEWARVTVKAIRLMQTEVLRKVGSSIDSVTSRQAVLGSSVDLQDPEDEDLRSPRWLEPDPHTPIRQRFLQHHGGSCESSTSLSSDTFTESEGDDTTGLSQGALLGLGDAVAFTDRTPSPNSATPPPLSRREIVSTVEKRLGSSNKSDLWNRRRVFRRYYSLSDSGNTPEEVCTATPRIVTTNEEQLRKAQSQDAAKSENYSNVLDECPDTSSRTENVKIENVKIELENEEVEVESQDKIEGVPQNESSASEGTPGITPEGATSEMTYHRYYHVFREGELVSLIQNHVEHLHILDSYYDNANWCVVAEKVQVWRI